MYNVLSKIVYIENSATFTGKEHLRRSPFFNKVSSLQPDILSEKSGKGVFLRLLQKTLEQLFDRTTPGDCL